jgi:20S proteasome subunit beta 2
LAQRDDAIALVSAAVSAGIFNDLGSGSNVDVCIITKDRTDMLRNYQKPNERPPKERHYNFVKGTTAWKKETIKSFVSEEVVTHIGGTHAPLPPPAATAPAHSTDAPMDTS